MEIRRAVLDDAEGIAIVHVDSWRSTYKGILPDTVLDQLSYEHRTELWVKNLSDTKQFIAVAVSDQGQIVAFATAGKRPSNNIKHAGDLTSIYALQEFQGKGIGKKLLKAAFEYFNQNGYQQVFVEVLEDNPTKHFYTYYGATFVKNLKIKMGGKELNESVYEWSSVRETLAKL